MLPYENSPFAEAHIANIDEVQNTLRALDTPSDHEKIETAIELLTHACWAIQRYEAAYADENRQKILYRDRWLATRPKL
jgi:hypothetical protein